MAVTRWLVMVATGVATQSAVAELPSISDLESAVQEQEQILIDVAGLESATSRVQNEVGGRLRQRDRQCSRHRSALARVAVLGRTWRDALQSARAQDHRLQRLRALPTIEPLIQPALHDRLDTLHTQLSEATTSFQVATAWSVQVVDVQLRGCQPALSASPRPADDDAVAWVVAWTGTVCALDGAGGLRPIPVQAPTTIRVSPPVACWSDSPCDCTPDTVASGMALGPAAP